MRVSIAVSMLAVVFLVLFSGASVFPSVFASTSGIATSCSSLAICNYTVGTTGSASTNAGIGGYVGQNFTFFGGSLSFKLPAEVLASNDPGVYSGSAINTKVFSSTAGLIYKITGSFGAPDYNTGKIVKGVTKGFVGIKGHSGRGGGIYFTLLNGTISFTPTNLYATVISVGCNPTSFMFGNPTTCTATVTNLLGTGTVPTGKVTFSSTLGFSPTKCSLTSGTCSVNLNVGPGTWPVYASYAGDTQHYKSSAQGPELYVGCPPGGC